MTQNEGVVLKIHENCVVSNIYIYIYHVFASILIIPGQFIINPCPNLRPFWGTLPLLNRPRLRSL